VNLWTVLLILTISIGFPKFQLDPTVFTAVIVPQTDRRIKAILKHCSAMLKRTNKLYITPAFIIHAREYFPHFLSVSVLTNARALFSNAIAVINLHCTHTNLPMYSFDDSSSISGTKSVSDTEELL
jgi:hypothetical protein